MNIAFPMIMTFVAGAFTAVGGLLVLLLKKPDNRLLSLGLGFAAGIMLMASILDLLPEAGEFMTDAGGNIWNVLLWCGLGFLTFWVFSKVRGECHHDGEPSKKMLHSAFITMGAVAVHNLPEGIALFFAASGNVSAGLGMILAVAIHNIPIGISIAYPVYCATGKKWKGILCAFATGMTELVGAVLGWLVLRPILNESVMGAIFAVSAGIMLALAITDLVPDSFEYGSKKIGFTGLAAGAVLMTMILFVL